MLNRFIVIHQYLDYYINNNMWMPQKFILKFYLTTSPPSTTTLSGFTALP
jgi:hypothetical protein